MSTHAQGVGQEPYDRWLMCWFFIIYIYLGEWREVRELLLQGRRIQKSQKKIESQKNGGHFLCWLAMGGSLGCY